MSQVTTNKGEIETRQIKGGNDDSGRDQKRDEGKKNAGEPSPQVINTIIGTTQEWKTSKHIREDHLREVYNVNPRPTSSSK